MRLTDIQHLVHKTAVEHGWWENTTKKDCPVPEKLCLIHSEVSEALEEYRNSTQPIYFIEQENPALAGTRAKPEGIVIELADVIIRILDLCGFMGWDIEQALILKMEYNDTRPYRHGGKKI